MGTALPWGQPEVITLDEPYPVEMIALADGTQVQVRAIRPDDAPRLQAFVERLSPQALYLRMMVLMKTLSDRDAARLANVDYDRSMALAALIPAEAGDHVIGVARYSADDQPIAGQAEVAIIVEDAYQRKGLARQLLLRLAVYARRHGISSFVAEVFATNEPVISMVRRSGLPAEYRDLGRGVIRVTVSLTQGAEDGRNAG